jgi:hypothetical protein
VGEGVAVTSMEEGTARERRERLRFFLPCESCRRHPVPYLHTDFGIDVGALNGGVKVLKGGDC